MTPELKKSRQSAPVNENNSVRGVEPELLVEVRRGPITESRHRGHIVAVDGGGDVVAHLGSPEFVTYLRSSAKPFQAIPLVTSGAAERFNFSAQELAIACGSHNGDPLHTETVATMLHKIGLDENALKCGTHEPYSPEAARRLKDEGGEPNRLQNNCSGKHAGMLALALHLGADIATYDHPEHPVQQAIARTVAEFSGLPPQAIAVGIDGCGVPVHGMSVYAMALMYARLVAPPASFEQKTRAACEQILDAMMSHPLMIGGPTESLDTALMTDAPHRLIAKAGAEGLFTAAIVPSEEWPRGLGLAIRIEDGDKGSRARRPAALEALRQLKLLDATRLKALLPYMDSPLRNHRGERVGEVVASFKLRQSGR
jgi:L-asparaginase II